MKFRWHDSTDGGYTLYFEDGSPFLAAFLNRVADTECTFKLSWGTVASITAFTQTFQAKNWQDAREQAQRSLVRWLLQTALHLSAHGVQQ